MTRVLIVDDNEDITGMVSMYLESQGIVCKIANHGQDGLELIKSESFDAILLDVALPGFSGYDVLQELFRDGSIKGKNIIVFTASSMSDSEKEKMRSMGARSFLKKPTPLDEILAAVKNPHF